MRESNWRNKKYSFFSHKECESFPCHKGIAPENFNCLFCYCPLFVLGDQCGGNFVILENGVKDCSACTFPHDRENYGIMVERLKKIIQSKGNRM